VTAQQLPKNLARPDACEILAALYDFMAYWQDTVESLALWP
jgi:hypothetical protein